MKRQNTFLLFIFFSFLPLPFIIGMFNNTIGGLNEIWDGISFVIVYVVAVLLFLMTFNYTENISKDFFIYKLIWLQEMFIISGICGTFLGFVFTLQGMDLEPKPGTDISAVIISNFAIALITLFYGVLAATIVYLIQKFHEMKNDQSENLEVEKPKEGFLFSSMFCLNLFIAIQLFVMFLGGRHTGGMGFLFSIENFGYIITILIVLILFYKGNSFVDLIKNIFWYVPDTEKNIVYNLSYIRNMKKIAAMFICISLICAPIVMLGALSYVPPEYNIVGWNNLPFVGLKNVTVQFLWVLEFIILLTIIEGREASKLYFETGKISAGDRFYSLKYILAPSFFLLFTVSFGVILSFIAL